MEERGIDEEEEGEGVKDDEDGEEIRGRGLEIRGLIGWDLDDEPSNISIRLSRNDHSWSWEPIPTEIEEIPLKMMMGIHSILVITA